MGLLRFELKSMSPEALSSPVELSQLDEFMAFREIEGLSDKWLYYTRLILTKYLDYVDWAIDKKKTLEYLSKIQRRYSTTHYRKNAYQIRKFLTFLHLDWAKDIHPPPEPHYIPKRINVDNIKDALSYFKEHKFYKQLRAIVLLGASSGLRAEELYQLALEDIDLESRTVYINHNPSNGQSTKTKMSRVYFL